MKTPQSYDAIQDALEAIWTGTATAAALETQELDFKQEALREAETMRELAETAACLANTDGGHVVVGVSDKLTGPTAILGSRLEPDSVRRRIRDLTRPALEVAATMFEFRETSLLILEVARSQEFHSDTKGRTPRRIGTECHPMDPVEQRQRREGRLTVDASAEPAEIALVAAESGLRSARSHLTASLKPDRRGLAALRDDDLLRALGVVDETGALLTAGAVLLAAEGTRVTYQYKDTPGGEPRQVERLTAPLLVAFDQVMALVAAHRRLTPLTLPSGQQLQVEDFPELAVREAISNALIHRDLRHDEPIVVEHSPQVLVISSPGPLVAGVTPDNILTTTSKPRNPALARASRTLELAEEVGRGVDRMYREMVRSGRQVPEIIDTGDSVRVALTGGAPNLNLARFVAEQPEALRDDTDAMLVLVRLMGQRTLTAQTVAPLLQKGAAETEASLRHLATDEAGLLEPTRETARRTNPSYRLRGDVIRALGTAVPYARHSSDEIERRVVAHMREYGRITNSTVQNLFNVRVQRANQILRDLRDRQLIIRTSEATRGPSVDYGKGPRFPEKSPRTKRSAQPALDEHPHLDFEDGS